MKRKFSKWSGLIKGLLLPAVAVCVLLCFATAFNSLDSGRNQESLEQLQEAIRRNCVACYAAEGAYPPSLEYLKEHYGVQIDEERYTVHYMVIADNLMPDITVLENDQ
ncbi:hypothetical protein AALA22_01870 [Anaerovoracaceae bacterium 41-7]|jgi:hypothetical protein|uniref:Uncharacterized protein n=1 Tax=Anaerotruncus colihominis TaxID=169435 RepID=A0A845QJH9_9FIRM|nr:MULTISPECIES: hypothetical protein [Clostridia]MCI9475039.1 hypothetical protein [Emergencia sp.]MCI9639822.1 hypothetical protein [Emergencia sp.]NBH61251.1 hypothetical protein [Anaerotruncus colihominis]NCE97793.1 hypothetical protein [Emergencia sp. 1XD21-10]NCF01906.1 hypothetical protein [Anaerotruncus sp. 80]